MAFHLIPILATSITIIKQHKRRNMKRTLTRAQAHNLTMNQWSRHPKCLDSQEKWDSYADKPFSWDVADWSTNSLEAVKCFFLTQELNGLFLMYKIPKKQICEIWKTMTKVINMADEKREIEYLIKKPLGK